MTVYGSVESKHLIWQVNVGQPLYRRSRIWYKVVGSSMRGVHLTSAQRSVYNLHKADGYVIDS